VTMGAAWHALGAALLNKEIMRFAIDRKVLKEVAPDVTHNVSDEAMQTIRWRLERAQEWYSMTVGERRRILRLEYDLVRYRAFALARSTESLENRDSLVGEMLQAGESLALEALELDRLELLLPIRLLMVKVKLAEGLIVPRDVEACMEIAYRAGQAELKHCHQDAVMTAGAVTDAMMAKGLAPQKTVARIVSALDTMLEDENNARSWYGAIAVHRIANMTGLLLQ